MQIRKNYTSDTEVSVWSSSAADFTDLLLIQFFLKMPAGQVLQTAGVLHRK